MLSNRLNSERDRFWLLNLNSDIVESIDVLADNKKYIRLIENEESIADILHGMCIHAKHSEIMTIIKCFNIYI